MSVVKAVASVFGHFSHKWFPAIVKEAEHSPATIAAVLFVWVTIIALAISGWSMLDAHAETAQQRDATLAAAVTEMKPMIAANTRALDCSRQDRAIGAKVRQINTTARLLERAADAAEKRDLQGDVVTLERELNVLELKYKSDCL